MEDKGNWSKRELVIKNGGGAPAECCCFYLSFKGGPVGAGIVQGCGVDLRVGVMWVVQQLKVRQVGVLIGDGWADHICYHVVIGVAGCQEGAGVKVDIPFESGL